MSRNRRRVTLPSNPVACAMLFAIAGAACAANPQSAPLADLSLEDLLKVEITSASRKAQKLYDTAAAVFVITQDDIQRSGANSIPEALRMVPGVQVARFGANKWAVSARGFNGRFADKLLVLLDGRSIYTPAFSGVVWEANDTLLENIDRIEVIRGPGAAMWGANAVNGVINIITREAKDTQGTQATAWAGNVERSGGSVRHGGTIGDDGHYRVYAKSFDLDHGVDFSGNASPDSMRAYRAGFRADLPTGGGQLMLSGEAHSAGVDDAVTTPSLLPPYSTQTVGRQQTHGFHLLGRWASTEADGSSLAIHGYLDRSHFAYPVLASETRDTVDFELQFRHPRRGSHDVQWGVGMRLSRATIGGGAISFPDPTQSTHLASGFVSDDIALAPDRVRLTLAARLEHTTYSGFELQPTARLLWTPSPEQSVWTSVSRAVRTPARVDEGFSLDASVIAPGTAANPGPLPALVRITSSPGTMQPEEVTALEAGLRRQLSPSLSIDIATFVNRYRKLRETLGTGQTLQLAQLPPYVLVSMQNFNGPSATTYGIELSADWRPASWMRVQPAYSLLRIRPVSIAPGSTGELIEGSSPQQQLSLRTSMSVGERHQLDFWLRHVDGLPFASIPAYTTLDARYAWRPSRGVELALVGQNLLDRSHPEFVSDFIGSASSQVQRGFYVKGRIEF